MVRKSPKRESILTEIEREDSSDHHSRDSLLPISNPDRTSNQRRCLADLRVLWLTNLCSLKPVLSDGFFNLAVPPGLFLLPSTVPM
ncbi:hypothetical protein NC652_038330 [Populus alba x Populus x berolinensis]|uniref:Uncharacterized protein n=1 Tax=Populus alba x Populus x berolinensis TaxID=444605 RepID=A0AAD6LGM5_9ROSI|nr:hypothetical protein NC652_038330 [Populus alba x Populus x berolinensis]KAJ6960274.1 hypothetical protein NC653_038339 [Populus alba x Populus x berolinensis]